MSGMLSVAKRKKIPLIEHQPHKKELKFGAFLHPEFLPVHGFQPTPAKKEVSKGKMKSYLLGLITIIKTGWVGKHDSAPEKEEGKMQILHEKKIFP